MLLAEPPCRSQHGLSQSATGKYASTVVEAHWEQDDVDIFQAYHYLWCADVFRRLHAQVVGNSEHELSAAAGARVFIIDAAQPSVGWRLSLVVPAFFLLVSTSKVDLRRMQTGHGAAWRILGQKQHPSVSEYIPMASSAACVA